MLPRFNEGDVCIFTSRGSSENKGNDGKLCEVLRIMDRDLWRDEDEPEYAIRFPYNGNSFGCRESELTSLN